MAAPTLDTTPSTGTTDAGGAWTHNCTMAANPQAGDVYIVQILQDGGSPSAISNVVGTNIEDLAGTANVWTLLDSRAIGSTASQRLYIGRAVSASSPTISGDNSTSEDLYIRAYRFADVSTGTTLATVIENGTAGSVTSTNGIGTTAIDASVTTLGPDRLALNFVAVNDDNAIAVFTGQSGGTWVEVAEYAESSGTDGAVQLQYATMASAGTIDGGTASITDSDMWGVTGFALIGTTADSTPKTGSLETGTVADSSSAPAAALSATESGTGTDAAALAADLAGTAESGTGTDAASVTVTDYKTGSLETATGTETATVTQHKTGTAESGTGTDAASLAADLAGAAESGTGTDAADVTQHKTGSLETGTGTDAATVSVPVSGSAESGTGTDAAALAAAVTGDESGTGTEAAALEAAVSGTAESGTGTDAATVDQGDGTPKTGTLETGTGTDAASLAADLAGAAESGIGSDAATVTQYKVGDETGTGTDAAALAAAVTGGAEAGTGTDATTTLEAVLEGTAESGTGTEAATVDMGTTEKTGALETGTATDTATLVAALSAAADSGTGTDAFIDLAAAIAGSETGTGTDDASVTQQKTASDSGTGTDAATVDAAYFITGFTRDGTGERLGSCVVHVFRTSDDVLIAETTSNASGVYNVQVAPGVEHYFVAYKAGSPDRAGTTVNTLVGS